MKPKKSTIQLLGRDVLPVQNGLQNRSLRSSVRKFGPTFFSRSYYNAQVLYKKSTARYRTHNFYIIFFIQINATRYYIDKGNENKWKVSRRSFTNKSVAYSGAFISKLQNSYSEYDPIINIKNKK